MKVMWISSKKKLNCTSSVLRFVGVKKKLIKGWGSNTY